MIIKVNKEARKRRLDDLYNKALNEIKQMADEGRSSGYVEMDVSGGLWYNKVTDRLKEHGIKICARGVNASHGLVNIKFYWE